MGEIILFLQPLGHDPYLFVSEVWRDDRGTVMCFCEHFKNFKADFAGGRLVVLNRL